MKSRTVKLITVLVGCIPYMPSHAQSPISVYSCPKQDIIVARAGEAMNDSFKDETAIQLETDASIGGIAGEFLKIEDWESKYRDYLQTASGYASKLKACSTII